MHSLINFLKSSVFLMTVALHLAACSELGQKSADQDLSTTLSSQSGNNNPAAAPADATSGSDKKVFFGDLHVHTKFSFDSWIFGTRATPDDAYEFAKGEPLKHASGYVMQLRRPLDFLAVTDHGTYLGMFEQMDDKESAVGQHPLAVSLRAAKDQNDRSRIFQEVLPRERGYIDFEDDLLDLGVVSSAWSRIIEAANRHNDPGNFTAFIGYEYTAGGREGENLHRNVIFKGDQAPELPFTRLDGKNNPERLWDWMDAIRESGIDLLAIPHNSNGSDGWMFEQTLRDGSPIDREYSIKRMRNEPLVEVTQAKGTSETHPLLSPNDELADFELMEYTVGTTKRSKPQGSYVRDAYLSGLMLDRQGSGNPFQFGLIGSSDTHTGAGSFREDDFWSKSGLMDIQPQQRGSVPTDNGEYLDTLNRFRSASGLVGVWAHENTRDAIFQALARKETFATSGPRMKVKFEVMGNNVKNLAARESGRDANSVTMGGSFSSKSERSPQFIVSALQDPIGAPLERLQIIKGWITDGSKVEEIFDIACAQGTGEGQTSSCADAAQMSGGLDCSIGEGSSGFSVSWEDPTFDSTMDAFYYVRVIEVPTCRWSTWDAIRAGVRPNPDLPTKIQERAWSSPIWYVAN
jgi:hypothetical protein